jgi:hypothetical protein
MVSAAGFVGEVMRDADHDSMSGLAHDVRRSLHRLLDVYEPLRSDLYRYCRYLTRSPWDAEDLAPSASLFSSTGRDHQGRSIDVTWHRSVRPAAGTVSAKTKPCQPPGSERRQRADQTGALAQASANQRPAIWAAAIA